MRSFHYYDLLELFEQPGTGCAICARVKMEGERYMTAMLYEYATDYGSHQIFRAARGLCNLHAWQMSHSREGMINVALFYEGAVDEVLSILNQSTRITPGNVAGSMLGRIFGGTEGEALAEKLAAEKPCPCCEIMTAAETRHIDAVVDGLGDDRFVRAFQKSDGFCLPHLGMVLQSVKDPTAASVVIQRQKEIWSKLKDELRVYINLYGLNGEGQARGSDTSSWLRAIANLAGDVGVFGDNLNRFKT
ncbi:MAG TPA: hypothetical protein VHL11_11695 [Phototrophicaceae bacterium]|jgi:hypothetical protein|nr:hypothetical protein [Phototrophicaceae bacterium]